MKTILSMVAIWMMTATACYGQIRAAEVGSAELRQQGIEYERHLAEIRERLKRAIETGRHLFGADKRWRVKGENALVGTFKWSPNTFRIGDWGFVGIDFEVINKISKSECLVLPNYKNSQVMLLRGLDMSKVTDGAKFVLLHPVVIQETYSYTTVAGSKKTVLVLERNEEKLREIVAKRHEKAEKERVAAEAERKAAEAKAWLDRWNSSKYTWTDKTGGFSVEAVYDDYLGEGKIRLLRENKSEIVIHLSKLNESSRLKAVELRRRKTTEARRAGKK